MSVKVSAGLHEVELFFWWEQGARGERVAIRDPLAARALLTRLAARGHTGALRRLTAAHPSAARLEDAALLDQLASWIAAGKLRIASSRVATLGARDGEVEEAPQPEPAWDASPPEQDEEEPSAPAEDALPPAHADGATLARMLKEAARGGSPFCEECAKGEGKPEAPRAAGSAHA